MAYIVSFTLLVLSLCSCSVNCWIINNVNVSKLATDLKPDSEFKMSPEAVAELRFTLIYPGTKWCGAGNIADNYDDLGRERAADICCRDHDNCPDIIEAGQTRYNLTNEAFYTRLSCQCDEQFRNCLRSTNSGAAKNIGTVYFNVLGTKCFMEDYPVVRCVKRGGWLNRKCLQYSVDTNAELVYQWFDVSNY